MKRSGNRSASWRSSLICGLGSFWRSPEWMSWWQLLQMVRVQALALEYTRRLWRFSVEVSLSYRLQGLAVGGLCDVVGRSGVRGLRGVGVDSVRT